MKKKWYAKLVVGLLSATLLLAGCGTEATEPTTEGDNQSQEPTTLRISMGLGESEWQVMKEKVFPQFEQEHNVKIEAVQIEAADLPKKLESMDAAGKMELDLFTQDNMALAPLVEKGLVEDLSGYRDMIPDEILPSLTSVGEFDDKLYFLPYRPNVEITYYNETKFNEAGLTPPTNWDELLNVAKTFKEQDGIGRVAIKGTLDGNTTVHLYDFIRSAGGDPMVLNDEGSVKAYTFLQELYPYLSPDTKKADWNTMNQYLANESVYLGQNWPFGVNVIVKDGGKEEIKAYHGWEGPVKESHVLGGEVIGIPKGSPNADLAMEFAAYLMSKEVQEIFVSELGWPASRSDAYGTVADWQKPYFEAVDQALATAEARPNVTYWADVEKATNDAFREIVMEGKPVKPTLDKYHDVLEVAKNK